MTFSERLGLKPVKNVVQTDSMDSALQNRLWNVFATSIWKETDRLYSLQDSKNRDLLQLCQSLWHDYFKIPVDTLPGRTVEVIERIREHFFNCQWNEVYDLIEFISSSYSQINFLWRVTTIPKINSILESELSGYRFIDGKFAPITSKESNVAIETAIENAKELFPNTSAHLRQAITLLARKPQPDFRNSIKESISAVESLCAAITGQPGATLGQALKVIDADAKLHGALRSAFEKLYGYTSDADGIRHALMEESSLEQEDAIFMLVSCSAFVSYVIAKQSRKSKA
jgi:hypothetical protein